MKQASLSGLSVPRPYGRARLIDAQITSAARNSDVLDATGYSKLILIAQFAGAGAGTDLIGAIEILGGGFDAALIADLTPITILATAPQSPLPTGLTIDGEGDGLAIANTFASPAPVILHFDRIPPKLAARLLFTSCAVPVPLTVDAYLL